MGWSAFTNQPLIFFYLQLITLAIAQDWCLGVWGHLQPGRSILYPHPEVLTNHQ